MTQPLTEEIIISDNINQYLKCFEEEDGKFKCSVAACDKKLSEKSAAIRHLKSLHPTIASTVDSVKVLDKADAIEVKTKINPIKFWNAILQLIIFSALPFRILNSKGFRYIIKPYVTGFKQAGIHFTVNIPNVQHRIEETAQRIKDKISSEVKGKLICLLLDIASRYNRSIFGINIVYWSNGKPCTRTIGMEALKLSQTGKNLYGLVREKLSKFGISLEQVFSVTTDNGKNLIKMTKLVRKDLSDGSDGSAGAMSDEESGGESSDEDENGNHVPLDCDSHKEEVFDQELFNEEYFEDLLSNVRNEFEGSHNDLFTGISCAAHGLHLVVKDAINHCTGLNVLIEQFRTLAKKLRTPKLRAELKAKKLKMAIIDVKIRWSYLFNIVSLIATHRSTCC